MRIGEIRKIDKGGNIIRVVRTEDDVMKMDGKDVPVYRLVYYFQPKGDRAGIVIVCVTKDLKELIVFPENEYLKTNIVVKLDKNKVKSLDDIVNPSMDSILKKYAGKILGIGESEDYSIYEYYDMLGLGLGSRGEKIFGYIMKAYWIILGVMAVVGISIFVKDVAAKAKTSVETDIVEKMMEKRLFGSDKLNDEVIRKWYGNVIDGVRLVAKGKKNLMIVSGPPGTGKSHVVRRELFLLNKTYGVKYIFIKGTSLSLPSFVSTLYQYNKDYIITIDDFDIAMNDPEYISILKSAGDSYEARVIELRLEDKMGFQQGAMPETYAFPERFIFKSRIIVITNKRAEDIDPALISRAGGVINVEFSPEDSVHLLKDLLPKIEPGMPMKDKEEIYNYIVASYKKYGIEPSVRLLRLLIDARLGAGPDKWRQVADDIMKHFVKRGTKSVG